MKFGCNITSTAFSLQRPVVHTQDPYGGQLRRLQILPLERTIDRENEIAPKKVSFAASLVYQVIRHVPTHHSL